MAVCCLQVRCWSNDSKKSVGLFTYFCSLVQTHSYASVLNHLFINQWVLAALRALMFLGSRKRYQLNLVIYCTVFRTFAKNPSSGKSATVFQFFSFSSTIELQMDCESEYFQARGEKFLAKPTSAINSPSNPSLSNPSLSSSWSV